MLPVHGNRFILHRVFRGLATKEFDRPELDMSTVAAEARIAVGRELARTAAAIQSLFPSSYLSTLFKNASKCKEISAAIDAVNTKIGPETPPAPERGGSEVRDTEGQQEVLRFPEETEAG